MFWGKIDLRCGMDVHIRLMSVFTEPGSVEMKALSIQRSHKGGGRIAAECRRQGDMHQLYIQRALYSLWYIGAACQVSTESRVPPLKLSDMIGIADVLVGHRMYVGAALSPLTNKE